MERVAGKLRRHLGVLGQDKPHPFILLLNGAPSRFPGRFPRRQPPSPPNADAELIAATKEPIGALSKPSEDAYRRQAAFFRRLGLNKLSIGGFHS